jgi:hypothetical protein
MSPAQKFMSRHNANKAMKNLPYSGMSHKSRGNPNLNSFTALRVVFSYLIVQLASSKRQKQLLI